MNYIEHNKAAWEEAFEHRYTNWGDDNGEILSSQNLPFLNEDVIKELKKIDFHEKSIAQFCCNNGRELLSIMQLGAEHGVGFDIAENIIEQAKETAQKTNQKNCEFVACNILDMDESYYNTFDFICFTIGAITWFKDLNFLFEIVSKCLKKGGILFIHDLHPFMNMLPMPGEDTFDPDDMTKVSYSYFRKEPWIENEGMSYITPQYESKTFTSFSHTMSDLINAIINCGMNLTKLNEYSYDVGLTSAYDDKGYPLSYILLAKKESDMNRQDILRSFWCAVADQNATELRTYFMPTACIRWHNTNEQFSVDEYIIANCEYPGSWNGEVERIELVGDMAVTVTRVWLSDHSASFHVTSFFEFCEDKISTLNEYWGDDGIAPQWRLDKHIGKPIK